LKAGEVLFSFGNTADRFYLVIAGEITVEVPALEGPALELQHLGPGAVVGWSWLIAPRKWNFQARARSAASLLEFDGDAVLAECERNPQFGYEILKRFSALMSERLNAARQRIMDAWRAEGFA
jgi:CRP-like cAMP-binding protein